MKTMQKKEEQLIIKIIIPKKIILIILVNSNIKIIINENILKKYFIKIF